MHSCDGVVSTLAPFPSHLLLSFSPFPFLLPHEVPPALLVSLPALASSALCPPCEAEALCSVAGQRCPCGFRCPQDAWVLHTSRS